MKYILRDIKKFDNKKIKTIMLELDYSILTIETLIKDRPRYNKIILRLIERKI